MRTAWLGPAEGSAGALRPSAPPPLGPTMQQVSPGQVKMSWTGCGVLQASSHLIAWADVSPTAVSPYSPSPLEAKKCYRVRYFEPPFSSHGQFMKGSGTGWG